MAFASVGTAGVFGNGGSANNQFSGSPANILEAGNLVIIGVAFDNTSTTSGNFNEITSVTDSVGGNTWTEGREVTRANGAAADGVTTAVFFSRLTNQIGTSDTITVNLANTVTDEIFFLWEFTVGADVSVVGIDNHEFSGNGYGSSVTSGLSNVEHLHIMIGGKESNSTSNLTPTTNFTAMSAGRSRNNALAIRIAGEFRISTSTGETSNPTHAITVDTASVFIALEEQAAAAAEEPNRMMMGIGI